MFEDEHPSLRLDPTDACYVDVIHSNAAEWVIGGLGIVQPVGHDDFYPNGGSKQPGCHHLVVNVLSKCEHQNEIIQHFLVMIIIT